MGCRRVRRRAVRPVNDPAPALDQEYDARRNQGQGCPFDRSLVGQTYRNISQRIRPRSRINLLLVLEDGHRAADSDANGCNHESQADLPLIPRPLCRQPLDIFFKKSVGSVLGNDHHGVLINLGDRAA